MRYFIHVLFPRGRCMLSLRMAKRRLYWVYWQSQIDARSQQAQSRIPESDADLVLPLQGCLEEAAQIGLLDRSALLTGAALTPSLQQAVPCRFSCQCSHAGCVDGPRRPYHHPMTGACFMSPGATIHQPHGSLSHRCGMIASARSAEEPAGRISSQSSIIPLARRRQVYVVSAVSEQTPAFLRISVPALLHPADWSTESNNTVGARPMPGSADMAEGGATESSEASRAPEPPMAQSAGVEPPAGVDPAQARDPACLLRAREGTMQLLVGRMLHHPFG